MLSPQRVADFGDGTIEPVFDFLGDAGQCTAFFFEFGNARHQFVAFGVQPGDFGGVALGPRPGLGKRTGGRFQGIQRLGKPLARVSSLSWRRLRRPDMCRAAPVRGAP